MQTLITDLSDKECRPTEIVVLTSCSASRRRESRAINSVPITIAGNLKRASLSNQLPTRSSGGMIIWNGLSCISVKRQFNKCELAF